MIEQKRLLEAQGILDTIQIDSVFLARHKFLNVAIRLAQVLNPLDLVESDPALAGTIDELRALLPEQVGVRAQALYNFLFKKRYLEEVYVPQQQNQRLFNSNTSEKLNESFSKIKVYPNPTRGELNFIFDFSDTKKYSIKIFDTQGKLLSSSEIESSEARNIKTISLNDIANGLYFYNVINDKGQATNGKFIIAK